MDESHSNASDRTSKSKSEPHFKFRGTWVPAEVHYLLADGEISTTEFVLLAVVDSLVDARGEGCWLSNERLAKRIGKDWRQTIRLINSLCERGLLRRVGVKTLKNGAQLRILETKWSRVGEREGVSPVTGGGGVAGDRGPGVAGDTQVSSSSYEEEDHRERSTLSPAPTGESASAVFTDEEDKTPADPTERGQLVKDGGRAGELWACLARNQLKTKGADLADWTHQFTLLRRKDEHTAGEIKQTLMRYVAHVDAGRMGKDKVPECFCAASFREKFLRIKSAFARLDDASAKADERSKPKKSIWELS